MPQNQTEFRKGMRTLHNIFVLKYLANSQIGRKEGKLVVLFIDLKAAFDTVDREVLTKVMRERGIRERLVEEKMRETKSRVGTGEVVREKFWTARGVKQGCPQSPLLLNILLADAKKVMGRVKWGGVKIRM